MDTCEMRIVNLEDRPTMGVLVKHVEQSYLRHGVGIRRGGQTVAVLLSAEAGRVAEVVIKRLRERKPPFTQDALNKWLDEVLEGLDVSAFMSDLP